MAAARSQSHELRLNWPGGDRFDAVLGAAYFTETARQQTTAAEDERYLKDAGNIGDPYGAATFVPGAGRLVGLGMTWRR